MKAIVRVKAGKEFSTMKVQEFKIPTIGEDEVRIRMKSSRINPVDMDLMKGFPSLKYKNPQIGGIDGAGEILETGINVNNFEKGDKVYFYRLFSDIGTWSEEISIPARHIAKIPANTSLQDAGSIALPLLTAYESIKSLNPKKGDSILIHGAGGGVGFMAVQVAKRFGLNVIANASGTDASALKEVGVKDVINYKTENFLEVLQDKPPTFVFDLIGKKTLKNSILLRPKKIVSIAFPDPSKMHKAGVSLPWIFRKFMRLANTKFINLAKRNNVVLIGQVTGANGSLLAEASELFQIHKLHLRNAKTISLKTVEEKGLSKEDVGKIIFF